MYAIEASQSKLFRVRESGFVFYLRRMCNRSFNQPSTFSGCLLESLFLFCRAFPQDASPLPLLTRIKSCGIALYLCPHQPSFAFHP